MLQGANFSFCSVSPYIVGNPGLADYFTSVCADFGKRLVEGNFTIIDNFMIDAYPQFNVHCNCGN